MDSVAAERASESILDAFSLASRIVFSAEASASLTARRMSSLPKVNHLGHAQ